MCKVFFSAQYRQLRNKGGMLCRFWLWGLTTTPTQSNPFLHGSNSFESDVLISQEQMKGVKEGCKEEKRKPISQTISVIRRYPKS